jgi:hypothetical protein
MNDSRRPALPCDPRVLPLARPSWHRLHVIGLDWPRLATGAEILCAGVAAVIAAYVVWSTVRLVIASILPVPYWDQWDELIFTGRRMFSSWLFAQHNEHRLVLPRLIFYIDYWLFAEDNRFNFICDAVLPFFIWVSALVVLWQPLARWRERIFVAAALAALLFSAMQWENFIWGFQVQWFLVELGAVGAFAILGTGRPGGVRVVFAILAESVAVYSLASGVSVPIIAIVLAVWRRYSLRQIGALVVAAIALLGFYLQGYHSPSSHSNPLALLRELGPIAEYIAVDLGNPFAQLANALGAGHSTRIAGMAGATGALAFVAAVIALMRSRCDSSKGSAVWFATAAYGCGAAVLMGLGRVRFGLGQAESSRYSTPMLLFWVALAMIGFTYAVRYRPQLRLPAMLAGICCLVPIAAAQAYFIKGAVPQVLSRKEAEAALLAGVNNPDALAKVLQAERIVFLLHQADRLRQQHLALFADPWSDWRGTPLGEHVHLLDGLGHCRGGFGNISRVPTRDGQPGWSASGWAWNEADRAPLEKIVLTDKRGLVIGYGLGGFPPPLAAEKAKSGWRSYFVLSAPGSVTAYGLSDGGKTACPLGTVFVSVPLSIAVWRQRWTKARRRRVFQPAQSAD